MLIAHLASRLRAAIFALPCSFSRFATGTMEDFDVPTDLPMPVPALSAASLAAKKLTSVSSCPAPGLFALGENALDETSL